MNLNETFADIVGYTLLEPILEALTDRAAELKPGDKIGVYRNLHLPGQFSIRHRGLVKAHAPSVHLTAASFRVGEAGRDRVRREKRKNVHATVAGTLVKHGEFDHPTPEHEGWKRVTYNPHVHNTFITVADQQPIHNAKEVVIKNTKEVWAR